MKFFMGKIVGSAGQGIALADGASDAAGGGRQRHGRRRGIAETCAGEIEAVVERDVARNVGGVAADGSALLTACP